MTSQKISSWAFQFLIGSLKTVIMDANRFFEIVVSIPYR